MSRKAGCCMSSTGGRSAGACVYSVCRLEISEGLVFRVPNIDVKAAQASAWRAPPETAVMYSSAWRPLPLCVYVYGHKGYVCMLGKPFLMILRTCITVFGDLYPGVYTCMDIRDVYVCLASPSRRCCGHV
jgi:hypothetical protein